LARVTPDQLDQVFHPMIEPLGQDDEPGHREGTQRISGCGGGQIVFTADDAEEWVKEGKKVLLVRRETSPEDIGGMHVAEGILTSTGGMTSHAAVVARGMGTPCVAGCKAVEISEQGDDRMVASQYQEGDFVTIDGYDRRGLLR
jgi:pyruvate,orthophosphate dikinase